MWSGRVQGEHIRRLILFTQQRAQVETLHVAVLHRRDAGGFRVLIPEVVQHEHADATAVALVERWLHGLVSFPVTDLPRLREHGIGDAALDLRLGGSALTVEPALEQGVVLGRQPLPGIGRDGRTILGEGHQPPLHQRRTEPH